MEDIKITLETLYDILRNEKKKEDLQKLEKTFFVDVVSYLREKQTLLESKKHSKEVFAVGEKDKLEYELRSIQRILKEIYEKREKKIMDIALNKSRTGSDIIDTSAMLAEEKAFYQRILGQLDEYRRGILLNLFRGELPGVELQVAVAKKVVPDVAREPTAEKKETLNTTEIKEVDRKTGEGVEGDGAELKKSTEEKADQLSTDSSSKMTPDVPEAFKGFTGNEDSKENSKAVANDKKSEEIGKNTERAGKEQPAEGMSSEEVKKTKIKFIRPMPSFVWKDMKVYGPFDPGEEIEIYSEVAELIVRKKRAERVEG